MQANTWAGPLGSCPAISSHRLRKGEIGTHSTLKRKV